MRHSRRIVSSLLAGVCASPLWMAGATAAPKDAPKNETKDKPLVSADLKDDAALNTAIREYYTKYEYRIPMRDGVHLFTSVYVPKDHSRTYPILMERTPYGAGIYGVDNYPGFSGHDKRAPRYLEHFVREGYILVMQDVRGCFLSEGTFVDVRPHTAKKSEIDESTDTYDSVAFLVKNVPANNGKVGLWGISYPGFYAALGMIDAHPALKAIAPMAPIGEQFIGDDVHHNGVFFEGESLDFFSRFGKPRRKVAKPDETQWQGIEYDGADAYDFFLAVGPLPNINARYLENKIPFWNQIMQHGTRDEFWKMRDPRPYYKNVKPAIMTVGGWFDAQDLYGTLETYRSVERQSPGTANTLVMGPWRHGGWHGTEGDRLGDVTFGTKTSLFYREHIEFEFFQRYLKGKAVPPPPEAWVYETGANAWQQFLHWPPAETKSVFVAFQAGGLLSVKPGPQDTSAFDAYVSDPAKPVPYREGYGTGINENYMSEDQRFAARRPDVLTYAGGALDGDVTLAGPIEANLWVSTTGTDADFVVKVIDVYPDDVADPSPNPTGVHMGGYQQLVRAEIMRGKFRDSFEKPAPFKPGEPAQVRFTLPDVLHTFRSGHRIMVQVQSSWFPVADRNPQTFTDIYRATEADFRAQTHRIHRSATMPSGIRVGLLRGALR